MARGKYLSLEEARRTGQLERFCKEHPTKAERKRFFALLDAMTQGVLEEEETSKPDRAASSSGIQTPRGT